MPHAEVAGWTSHLRILLAAIALALLAISAFNLTLDPFGAYRIVPLPALRGFREGLETRIARAEILERGDCETVVVGTSRAQVALDPEQPLWGRPTCNLSITGAGIAEVQAVVRRVLQHPEVREIVWTLDLLSFDTRAAPPSEFARSRFNADLDRFDYHASLLLGEKALRASWRVLRDYRKNQRVPYSERGWTDPGVRVRERQYRERFLWSLERDVLSLGSAQQAFRYDGTSVASSTALAREALRRGIAVQLVILPSHALHFENVDRYGAWESFERWKRDLVRSLAGRADAPALWDCTGYAGPKGERVPQAGDDRTQMRWHWDSSHIKRSLGDAVLEQIRGAQPSVLDDDGAPLRPCRSLCADSLEAVLASVREEQSKYRADAADQLELLDLAQQRAGALQTTQKR
jgi:hypothetical protein